MTDSTTLFDHEADDLTQEFWGQARDWATPDRSSRSDGREDGRTAVFQVRSGDATEAFRLDHTPTSMRAIREGIAAFRPKRRWRDDPTGPVERTREHKLADHTDGGSRPGRAEPVPPRRPAPHTLPHRDATIADLAAGTFDEARPVRRVDDFGPTTAPMETIDFDEPMPAVPRRRVMDASPSRPPASGAHGLVDTVFDDAVWGDVAGRATPGGRDPLVTRVLTVIVVLLLAIPLALILRDNSPTRTGTAPAGFVPGVEIDDQSAAVGSEAAASTAAVPSATGAATEGTGGTAAAAVPVAAVPVAAASGAASVDSESPAAPAEPESAVVESSNDQRSSEGEAGSVDATAERVVPDCSLTYTAAPGDSWYRMADEAGITPAELVHQNGATLDTTIYPGDEICLPQGASVPSPPPTTTAAPTTTEAPTVAAPTTTNAPSAPASRDEVQAMIREIWPDDLEDRALEIAYRESRYVATADNGWCCVGVFQIYWTVHRNWLDDYGIDTRDDLMDARKNITAAYALYQRAGGWGPWGF